MTENTNLSIDDRLVAVMDMMKVKIDTSNCADTIDFTLEEANKIFTCLGRMKEKLDDIWQILDSYSFNPDEIQMDIDVCKEMCEEEW